MAFTRLTNRRVLRLEGEDRVSFLQGLLTCDVAHLTPGQIRYGALLTPQGKFLYGGFLYGLEEAILMDVGAPAAPALLARLKQYVLRSKVQVTMSDEAVLVARPGTALEAGMRGGVDPRLPEMGLRAVVPAGTAAEDDGAYELRRFELGVPDEAVDLISEKDFPLMFGFEDLGAVDFKKGCYVGQEVTARTKHRGRLAKILCRVRAVEGGLPPFGAPLMQGVKEVGQMRSGRGGAGLALVAAEAAGEGSALTYESGSFSVSVASWFKMGLEASERGGSTDSAQ